MDESILQRLDERTDNLIKIVDRHVDDDKKKFEKLFSDNEEMKIKSARQGVIISAIIIFSQIIIGAWVKGLF